MAWRPRMGFCYEKLKDWLERKLLGQHFEDLVKAHMKTLVRRES